MTHTSKLVAVAFAALVSLLPSSPPASAQEAPEEGADPAAAQPPPKKQTSRASVKRLFEIIKAEPTVKECQKAAVKHYRLEPERINALARNARLKGLVPNLSASFSNEIGNRFTNTKDGLFPVLPS